ncbi:ATP-binding cassette domain-containing protein (plasmid) [Thioclava sp. 'Guangxiensis']|uniref:ATP-binding cassette domain-containing protein n=1 Tax=Thioclava sp. 'Guangxiensis' TaxID=3149044 RepID=UPI0032C416E1
MPAPDPYHQGASLQAAPDPTPQTGAALRQTLRESTGTLAFRAALGVVLLVALAIVLAPRAVSAGSLFAMAPFIGVLGVAAIGQYLVIQQRGFDLSVAGTISVAAVMMTALPASDAGLGATLGYVALTLICGALIGLVNGALVTFVRVPPLIVTIGTNSLLVGLVYWMTGGSISSAPSALVQIASARVGLVSVLFLAFLLLGAALAWGISRTRPGRQFLMSAVSADAARALGIPVSLCTLGAYTTAGLLFALAGVMLAGLAVTPTLLSGNPYMLTTVAAVIVGGSPLNGDRGSVLATMIGAVFLVLLDQIVVSLGFDYAIQSIVQAAIILAGVTLPQLIRHIRNRPQPRPKDPASRPKAAVSDKPAVLELRDIHKHFGKTIALDGVDLSVSPGEVHAVIGENGAGKSTLISVACGVLPVTLGEVVINGQRMQGADPDRFRAAGIAVAFQHPPLPPHLSVLECLSLADPSLKGAQGAARVRALIAQVTTGALAADPHARISDLTIGQRHVVEIARALASDPRIIVLDEPTEPFKEEDVRQLFALIRRLRERGVAIVYISHRLDEVEEIADRISVLRDGALIATRPRDAFTRADIVSMIVGRPVGQVYPPKAGAQGEAPLLELRDFSGQGFNNINLTLRPGEILGLAGVEGQGQRDVMRALAGLAPHSGTVTLHGEALEWQSRAAAREAGVAYVPDDRHKEGLFMSMSIAENLGAGVNGEGLRIDRLSERSQIAERTTDLRIKAPSHGVTINALSGGNQQKVLIGREILGSPRIFLADEPTKGVDIGSKSDIYHKLRALAAQGVAVIVASSDGVELEGLCDHVAIMARGEVAAELSGDHVNDAEITAANLTAGGRRETESPATGERSMLRGLLDSKWFAIGILTLACALIVQSAVSVNSRFLSPYNLDNVQIQMATLALIAFGQLFLILQGEIDFSVGPMAGFVVVLSSFWIPDGISGTQLVFTVIGILAITTAMGFLQGLITLVLGIPSIIVTLAAFFALQGLSLYLRPVPGGIIDAKLIDGALMRFGPVTLAAIVAVMLAVGLELVLMRTAFGKKLRALGSDGSSAAKLGAKRKVLLPAAFALNGFLVGLAGLILAATVGVGSGTTGANYSLMAITAVVLGGAVISGGMGSFIATIFGALLIQLTFSATTFMQVGTEWQYWLVGLVTLFAASLFALGRRTG